jgi:carbon monoxide dehydrogenase subunit G
MIVDRTFTVAAPAPRVFEALLDLERLVRCVPGARCDGVAGGGARASGQVRLLFGGVAVTYRGTLRITASDRNTGSVSLLCDAAEVRGAGRLVAAVDVRLGESGGVTTISLAGTSEVTGRAAAVQPDVMMRSVSSVLTRFSAALGAGPATPGRRAPRRHDPTGAELETAIRALEDLEAPQRPHVRGTVTIVTDGPVEVTREGSVADGLRRELRDRPWLIPAALIAILAIAVAARRHRTA